MVEVLLRVIHKTMAAKVEESKLRNKPPLCAVITFDRRNGLMKPVRSTMMNRERKESSSCILKHPCCKYIQYMNNKIYIHT